MVNNTITPHQQKFHVIPRPLMAPGVCAFTGKHQDDFFIDLGLSLDYFGAVYMSASYFKNILRILLAGGLLEDVLPPVERAEGPQIPPQLEEILLRIEKELNGANSAVDGLVKYIHASGMLTLLSQGRDQASIIVSRDEEPRSGVGAEQSAAGSSESGSDESDAGAQLERVSNTRRNKPAIDL